MPQDKKWDITPFARPRSFNMENDNGLDPNKNEKHWMRPLVTFISFLNFVTAVVFAFILLVQALREDVYKSDVVQTHRTCILAQTNNTELTGTPSTTPDFFTNVLMGASGTPVEVLYEASQAEHFVHFPRIWQYFQSNAQFTLTVIHSQFLVFVALWIGSAYALCTTRVEAFGKQYDVEFSRIYLVSIWNMIGLIVIVIMFLSPRSWGQIPLSNFFCGVGFLLISWIYQFCYMVEIDKDNKEDTGDKFRNEFTWMRRVLYLEFATTVPLFLVAAVAPGAEGIEQWRIQTTLFCSYTFFSILGLLERWKHLGHETAYQTVVVDAAKLPQGVIGPIDQAKIVSLNSNKSAAWYLVYAAAMSFFAVVNAIARELWFTYYTYYLGNTILARVAAIYVLAMMGLIVFAFLLAYVVDTVMGTIGGSVHENMQYFKETWVSPVLHAEALLVLGSFVIKILFFAAMVNAAWLSKTEMIYT
jgi:hypothetical protein